jgi:hypothetical protein
MSEIKGFKCPICEGVLPLIAPDKDTEVELLTKEERMSVEMHIAATQHDPYPCDSCGHIPRARCNDRGDMMPVLFLHQKEDKEASRIYNYVLCHICYNTPTRYYRIYEREYRSTGTIIVAMTKTIAYCTNLILDKLDEAVGTDQHRELRKDIK